LNQLVLSNYKFSQRHPVIYGVSALEKATLFAGCGIAGINRLACPDCKMV